LCLFVAMVILCGLRVLRRPPSKPIEFDVFLLVYLSPHCGDNDFDVFIPLRLCLLNLPLHKFYIPLCLGALVAKFRY
jgi:hypothetical protein